MTIKYKLVLKENTLPKNATLLQYGSLSIQAEVQKYPNGLQYVHNECVGAFIRKNDSNNIMLYASKDFGDEVGCIFTPKKSDSIYYLSGYNKNDVIDEIIITEKIGRNMPVATKINEDNNNG